MGVAVWLLAMGVARAEGDLDKLMATFQDESAPIAERETALARATAFAANKQNEKRAEPMRAAVRSLIERLHAKCKDGNVARLCELAWKGLDPFAPVAD